MFLKVDHFSPTSCSTVWSELTFSTNFCSSHRTGSRVLPIDRARRELSIGIRLVWCIEVWEEGDRVEVGAGLGGVKLTLDFLHTARHVSGRTTTSTPATNMKHIPAESPHQALSIGIYQLWCTVVCVGGERDEPARTHLAGWSVQSQTYPRLFTIPAPAPAKNF